MNALSIALLATTLAAAGEYGALKGGYLPLPILPERHEIAPAKTLPDLKENGAEVSNAAFDESDDYVISHAFGNDDPPKIEKVSATSRVALMAMVTKAAQRAQIPPALAHSVAMVESGYRHNVVSPAGAVGLMQLMPATARAFSLNPYDVRQNAEAGTRYLAKLLHKYRNDKDQMKKAVAAYNAGPGAVDRHNGVPPYPETRQYVKKVLSHYKQLKKKGSK